MTRCSRAFVPAVLIVPLLITACGSESTDLPPGLGPIAFTTDMALPTDCEAGNASGVLLAIGNARSVLGNPSYNERKGRGCFPYTMAQVWAAMQTPGGMDVSFYPENADSECQAWLLPVTDPQIPVTFITKEIPFGTAIVRANSFEVTWRIGVTQGTTAAPTEIKVLYGKTAGTTQVPKILGSMVFTPDPVRPGWTRMDIVRQLNANGWSDEPYKLQTWIQGYHDGLMGTLRSGQFPIPGPLPGGKWCTIQ
jgi:hypothetical protein